MELMHRHEGLMKSGKLRNHPMSQLHKDKLVKEIHNEDIKCINNKNYNKYLQNTKFTQLAAQKPKKEVEEVIEKVMEDKTFFSIKDGFVMIDMTENFLHDGLRIKFKRTEGEKRRTIGLEIKA